MITEQADPYISVAIKPNSLAMVDAVNCQLLAMGSGSIRRHSTYGYNGRSGTGTYFTPRVSIYLPESFQKCSLRIHEFKFGFIKFNDFQI